MTEHRWLEYMKARIKVAQFLLQIDKQLRELRAVQQLQSELMETIHGDIDAFHDVFKGTYDPDVPSDDEKAPDATELEAAES